MTEQNAIRPLAPYRVLIARSGIGCILLFLLLREASGLLPHQLLRPVIFTHNYDLTQWVYKLSGLAGLTAQHPAAARLFTGITFCVGVLAFLFPRQRRFVWPFIGLFFVQALAFNVWLAHNSHYLAGAVWLCLALWPRKDKHFEILWDGLRYYACFAYAAAGLWKVAGGAFWQGDNGLLVARDNLSAYLFYHPHTAMANVYYWLLDHPVLINAGGKLVAVAECAFLIGFFTKRFDRGLILLLVFIHTGTYFFADVFFLELLIFILPLLPRSFWQRLWLKTVPKSVHHLAPEIQQVTVP